MCFRNISFSVLMIFFCGVICFSQSKGTSVLISRASHAEKIYLQLSNTAFTTTEIIWFKAIVTNTLNQPSERSGVLYVELIDFDENIIDTKTLKLESGIADSFFELNTTLPSGRYLIRAYTQWNRNFGEDFIFKKYIDVFALNANNQEDIIKNISLTEINDNQIKLSASISPEALKADYKKDLTVYIQSEEVLDSVKVKRQNQQYIVEYVLPKDLVLVNLKVKLKDTRLKNRKRKTESTYAKTIALNKDFLDLQFFPEGGKMIDSLTNKIAYKAINYKGLGEMINGYIVDETDSIIRPFRTNILGMGFTYFTPSKHKRYYGKLLSKEGVTYKYPLPLVSATGYTLSAMDTRDYIVLNIKSNIAHTDSLYVEVRSRGVLIQKHDFKLKNGTHKALVKKIGLPNGIINITLFNRNSDPISERLFFNYNEDNILNITAKSDKQQYRQRDKTIFNVAISDSKTDSINANFSVLVLDKNKETPTRKSQPNMMSYFLLNSELKGFIENPNYYFNPNNMLRKLDLEALMLTQGWRDYIYEKTDTDTNFEFQPETNIHVKGKIKSVFDKGKPPKTPVNLSMITKPSFGMYTAETDSLGAFTFSLNNYFADNQSMIIQTKSKKGKSKNFNITIDDPLAPPTVNYKIDETVVLVDTIYKKFLKESITQYETNNDFKTTSETIALDAVELTGYNVTPEREKIFELHGAPDLVIDNEDLVKEEEKWMSGLYDLLLFKFPDDIIFNDVTSAEEAFGFSNPLTTSFFKAAYVTSADFTFVLIDGEVVRSEEYSLLPFLPIDNIKHVEIFERPRGNLIDYIAEAFPLQPIDAVYKKATANFAFINIYTFGKNGIASLEVPKGIYKGAITGFSTKREFYTPKYNNLQDEDWSVPDLRCVIHWKPLALTDKRGLGQIEFYNGDNTGEMLVVIEAIIPNGKMGYVETTYTVEERNEK